MESREQTIWALSARKGSPREHVSLRYKSQCGRDQEVLSTVSTLRLWIRWPFDENYKKGLKTASTHADEAVGLRLSPGSTTKMIIRKNQPPAELVPKDLDLPDGRVYEITAPVTSIGRSPENDIVLEDLTVSRHHATIRLEDDGYYVHDSGSKNGTIVNGQTAVKRKIVDADRIQIGQSIFIFMLTDIGLHRQD